MIAVDVTVIGAGIVGCAVADAAARPGRTVVLLEKEARPGAGVTSRNSEVGHGGMYYPTGSLKARCCVRGRRRLREFCGEAGVGWRDVGKLIVACDDAEVPGLERLLALGEANGVEDLALLGRDELRRLEPQVAAVAALHSPRTGILDAEGAARALAARAAGRGAEVMTGAEVTGLARRGGVWEVAVRRGAETWTHASRQVVNCAGLHADEVAAMAGLDVDGLGLRQRWVKGNYFAVDPRHAGRLSRLVYPVPPQDRDTLGVHVCLDLAGQMRLGPDFETVPRREDYGVDPARAGAFFAGAARFLPWLAPQDLQPAMSGLRPKLDTDAPFADFQVRRETGDLEGLIDLIGIDSPGLTSAPALAELVAALLDGREPWTAP
ncbi:MAG: NAD(P)/FAD-dependent oxidoreductase [bacterium]|nr:NAD(P)/FAD-dependent oxidoreductase [bacterium]